MLGPRTYGIYSASIRFVLSTANISVCLFTKQDTVIFTSETDPLMKIRSGSGWKVQAGMK
jgi:hypothetical protein